MKYPLKMRLIQRQILVYNGHQIIYLFYCDVLFVLIFDMHSFLADVFKPNPTFLDDEKAYENLKTNILGAESSEDEDNSDAASDDEDDEDDEDEDEDEMMKITDETETNLVNLRRTIYLTIMSSVDFEEAGHKLLKIKLEPGQEVRFFIFLELLLDFPSEMCQRSHENLPQLLVSCSKEIAFAQFCANGYE